MNVATARRGRPLRVFGAVAAGWVGLRVVMLWPQIDTPADVLDAVVPLPILPARAPYRANPQVPSPTSASFAHPSSFAALVGIPPRLKRSDAVGITLPLLALQWYGNAQDVAATDTPILPGLPSAALPADRLPSRWSGSVWLVARGGTGIAPGVVGGQLGGSQAGVRIAYRLDRIRRIALAGRITTPLGTGLREAALGVEWQPARLPVRIVAEQRIAIDGGRGGPALGIVGGFGPVGIPHEFRLEGYGQAGVIHRDSTEAYTDGAIRITHPLAALGGLRFDLGASAWGAAQRGATRLDLGPSLVASIPLGPRRMRLSFDWRQRVAGDAHPGSGPALTLGADF